MYTLEQIGGGGGGGFSNETNMTACNLETTKANRERLTHVWERKKKRQRKSQQKLFGYIQKSLISDVSAAVTTTRDDGDKKTHLRLSLSFTDQEKLHWPE